MKSDVYFASPVTLRGPSIRGVSRPIGEVAGDGCVVAMIRSFCKTKVNSFLARLIFLVPWGRNVYRSMTPKGSFLALEERNVLELSSHGRKHCAPLERG